MILIVAGMTVVFAAVMLVVTLVKVPVPLVAVDDAATTNEDTNTTVTVLSNDTDEDTSTLAIDSYTQPGHGYVIKSGTGLRYTPYSNYNGTDTFTYTVKNSAGETATATVTITITPVNDSPKAYNDVASTDMDTAVTIDVVLNDTDVDDDVITIDSYLNADHGTVTITDDNTILYVPDEGYVGEDDFSYVIVDASGASDTGSVTVTVRSPQD
jgi:hypothetical protein